MKTTTKILAATRIETQSVSNLSKKKAKERGKRVA